MNLHEPGHLKLSKELRARSSDRSLEAWEPSWTGGCSRIRAKDQAQRWIIMVCNWMTRRAATCSCALLLLLKALSGISVEASRWSQEQLSTWRFYAFLGVERASLMFSRPVLQIDPGMRGIGPQRPQPPAKPDWNKALGPKLGSQERGPRRCGVEKPSSRLVEGQRWSNDSGSRLCECQAVKLCQAGPVC